MDDLALQDVPRDGEIVELLYQLSRSAHATHLDMTVSTGAAQRRLRFVGPRVVQFQAELPEVLHGLDVQDIRDQGIGGLTLWVSVGGGAVTFWAKAIKEITDRRSKTEGAAADHRASADPTPLIEADQVHVWGPTGLPQSSFRYRSPGRGGALRHFSVSTRPYVRM
ncbi:MAG: hypothetical protein QM820_09060 [Minicystis sp.]